MTLIAGLEKYFYTVNVEEVRSACHIDSVLLQANFRNRGSAADPSHVIPSIQRLRVLEASSTKRKSTRLCANSSYPSALRKQLVFLIGYGMSIVAFSCSQGTIDIDVFYYRSLCFFPSVTHHMPIHWSKQCTQQPIISCASKPTLRALHSSRECGSSQS